VLQLALQYRLNYWSRDFFDAFGRRDGSGAEPKNVSTQEDSMPSNHTA
jgi:hypothetical protein